MAVAALAPVLAVLLLGCASRGAEQKPGGPSSAAVVPAPTTPSPAPPALGAPADPTLIISDLGVLAELEDAGLALGAVLGASGTRNDELSRAPRWQPVVATLEAELARAAAADPLAGVDVGRFSHRLFDRRFLRDPRAWFELVGVVNRPDRAPFHAASCGETRLIYRLRYALDAERASKLPMTVGIELAIPRPNDGCAAAAARWLEPASASVAARAAWLRSPHGPLSPATVTLTAERVRLVVNLQVVRWPSTVRPDLGGHAEYVLRAFRPNAAGALRPEPLENTVDPAALRDAGRRRALLDAVAAGASELDAGLLVLPAPLLAEQALSVTPRGLNRLANRPFSSALRPSELQGVRFEPFAQVRTGAAALRRLDQLSCQGCHAARSVAGFHFLGEDSQDSPPENALASAVSPQVSEDLPRRLRVARQMLAGIEPDFTAPFAERAAVSGHYGSHCSLGRDPSFASWTCAADLTCSDLETAPGDPLGQCLPPAPQVGDACERGAVKPSPDRRRDRLDRSEPKSCGAGVCNRSAVGFPAGMCTASCGDAGAACGAIAVLDPFNACLARGASFLSCIRDNTRPAGLRGCSAAAPCRDDYVCARGERGGVCLPPYFVFQLRVDGHSTGLSAPAATR